MFDRYIPFLEVYKRCNSDLFKDKVGKVMGASTYRILLLLSVDSSRYIIIAFGLALLPAYYLIGYWLQQFDDHISVSYIELICTGAIAYCDIILLVAYISDKTSNTNPLNLLRYE